MEEQKYDEYKKKRKSISTLCHIRFVCKCAHIRMVTKCQTRENEEETYFKKSHFSSNQEQKKTTTTPE